MAAISLGRFERWLEKFFTAKGGGVVVDLEPSIRVVLQLASGQEDRFLQSWTRWSTALLSPAVAAQTSSAQLRNPATSNVVAVIERLGVHLQTAATLSRIQIGANASGSDLSSTQTANTMDPRQQNTNSSCIPSQGSGGSASVFIDTAVLNALETQIISTDNQEIALLPGQVLRVTDLTVNEAMIASFMWRERALEQSELT